MSYFFIGHLIMCLWFEKDMKNKMFLKYEKDRKNVKKA